MPSARRGSSRSACLPWNGFVTRSTLRAWRNAAMGSPRSARATGATPAGTTPRTCSEVITGPLAASAWTSAAGGKAQMHHTTLPSGSITGRTCRSKGAGLFIARDYGAAEVTARACPRPRYSPADRRGAAARRAPPAGNARSGRGRRHRRPALAPMPPPRLGPEGAAIPSHVSPEILPGPPAGDWPLRRVHRSFGQPPSRICRTIAVRLVATAEHPCQALDFIGVPNGIRTRVTNVKGWCPRPLDDGDEEGSAGRPLFRTRREGGPERATRCIPCTAGGD